LAERVGKRAETAQTLLQPHALISIHALRERGFLSHALFLCRTAATPNATGAFYSYEQKNLLWRLYEEGALHIDGAVRNQLGFSADEWFQRSINRPGKPEDAEGHAQERRRRHSNRLPERPE